MPLGNREGQGCDEQSQETCHSVESQVRCPRLVLPTFSVSASIYIHLTGARDKSLGRAAAQSAAVFYVFSEQISKRGRTQ